MNILLASSEVFPYSKTGGLADMVGALAKALADDGHHVSTLTPLYRGIREKHPEVLATEIEFDAPLGGVNRHARIFAHRLRENHTVYFIDEPEFYDRASLYVEGGKDYSDNAARFIFFSRCVVEMARRGLLPARPDLVHVHDWQAGLIPLMIRHERRNGWKEAPASMLTIHNLAYQGVFPSWDYSLTNLPWEYFHQFGAEYYGQMNCLKAGIVYADMITTVSPRYSREITTEQFGYGLDGVLRARQDRLVGILNGVDYSEWNTETNPFLKFHYSADNLNGKMEQKRAIQAEMGLPVDDHIPLFGAVTRLADQKGVDIQLAALEEMLSSRMQFVLLGSGDPVFERAFVDLAVRYPQKVAVRVGYNHGLSHRIEAGCDFFIMPSKFEPCGLNQMYSLRYGTIPIVRVTGGLDDSVTDLTEDLDAADGIKFFEYSARALSKAIRKALVLYENADLLNHFRVNGMRADFSWEHCTHEYEKVFKRALRLKGA